MVLEMTGKFSVYLSGDSADIKNNLAGWCVNCASLSVILQDEWYCGPYLACLRPAVILERLTGIFTGIYNRYNGYDNYRQGKSTNKKYYAADKKAG